MQVYIEYAFIENFLLDSMLLFLAFRSTKTRVRALPAVCAASFGAAFACVFALISVPYAAAFFIKVSAGALMCFFARLKSPKVFFTLSKTEKKACFCAFLRFLCVFFLLSACLAGVFFAIDYTGAALKAWQIPVCVFFVFACVAGAKRLFKAQKTARFIRRCELRADGKTRGVEAYGLIDSGNRAVAGDGAPICFISPELAFLLWDGRTETRDFTISTVSGTKKIKIFSGTLLIYEETQAHTINKRYFRRVYFSPSAHVSAGGKGGYSVLLPACCASVMEETAAQGREESAAERRMIAAEVNTAEEAAAQGREASAAEIRRNAAEVNTAEEKPTEEIAAGKATQGREASAAERRRIAAKVNMTEEKPTEEIAAGKGARGKEASAAEIRRNAAEVNTAAEENPTQGKGTKTDEV